MPFSHVSGLLSLDLFVGLSGPIYNLLPDRPISMEPVGNYGTYIGHNSAFGYFFDFYAIN